MPGLTMAMELVEPQSLKKLSFESLKRALDIFSPVEGYQLPPDPANKRIRLSQKYGRIKGAATAQTQNQGKTEHKMLLKGLLLHRMHWRFQNPQVLTGSHDWTIKFWDLRNGKTMTTLTHHKKSVRALEKHPKENCFAFASAHQLTTSRSSIHTRRVHAQHANVQLPAETIINAMAVNEKGVMATRGNNGSLWFWDWKSWHNFQQSQTTIQPGRNGTRLITCEADKTIKCGKDLIQSISSP